MQTEQETFIQQCKENNKKFVKVFLTSIIQLIKIEFDNSKDIKEQITQIIITIKEQNIPEVDVLQNNLSFFDSDIYFIHLLHKLKEILLGRINSKRFGIYTLIDFNYPLIPAFLLTILDEINIDDSFFRYLLYCLLSSFEESDEIITSNIYNMFNYYRSTLQSQNVKHFFNI